MRIPTDEEILGLHEKHAPTAKAFDSVYTHCVIVCGIAEQLHSRMGADQGIDIDLTRAGALLHDVGVYRLYEPPATSTAGTTSVTGSSGTSCSRRRESPKRSAGSPSPHRGRADPR